MAEAKKIVTPTEEKFSPAGKLNENNGLILYSYHHCYYTQKVLMALYEKRIPFTTKLVDITKKEQYQLWYLKINPKGEVPVLKDGIKFIPDSERIIQYLEDNFSNGGHSRLIPIDQGPEIRQKVLNYHSDFEKIPANVLTLGSLFNKEFCSNMRYPFVLPFVQNLLKESEKSGGAALRDISLNFKEFSETLLQKSVQQQERYNVVTNKTEFSKVLQQVSDLMDKVEEELAGHDKDQSDWWLCTDRFTIADVSLSILLDRLSRIGLESYFWGQGKRPNIDKYYKRVQKRDSYKKSIPTFVTDLTIILKSKAPIILAVITVVVGSFFYFKK